MTTIGERIYARRRELGLSQRQISSPGVSYAYVSRIENGTREPSVKALRKLAAKLGVSAHWLETGEDDPAEELARIVLEQQAGQPERAVRLARRGAGRVADDAGRPAPGRDRARRRELRQGGRGPIRPRCRTGRWRHGCSGHPTRSRAGVGAARPLDALAVLATVPNDAGTDALWEAFGQEG